MARWEVDFAEYDAQELVEKAKVLPREIQWHFIGRLTRRKAKKTPFKLINNIYIYMYVYMYT